MTAALDSLEEALETSDCNPLDPSTAYYGSVDHHDGFAPALPQETSFRHASWAPARRRVYASLVRTGSKCRRLQHFVECGSQLWLLRDGETLELAANSCHDRLCLMCQKQRQADVIEGVTLRMLESDADCRFLTLTIKHSDSPLEVQLERLVQSFRSLRKHPDIAPKLLGGVWFIEVKLSKDRARWHPHLHVIGAGKSISSLSLSQAWLQVTGDSYITDIRTVGDPAKRARYVTKYATKPLHNDVTHVPAKLDEFVVAIKGRRLYQCFGTWSKAVTRSKLPPRNLTRVGHVDVLWRKALAGDIDSLVLMHRAHARWPALKTHYPIPSTLSDTPPP